MEKPIPLPRRGTTPSPSRRLVPKLKKRPISKTEEIHQRRYEYMIHKDFKIYVASWNVDGLDPCDISLSEWLHTTDEAPDIYAVGLQEIDMDADTILMGDTKVVDEWVKQILLGTHSGSEYEVLCSVRFVGMQLSIIIKQEMKSAAKECMTAMVARGPLNKYGNKGGVGISFCFHESLFCFINCHFHAYQSEVDLRNEDFQEITQRMVFEQEGNKGRRISEHE